MVRMTTLFALALVIFYSGVGLSQDHRHVKADAAITVLAARDSNLVYGTADGTLVCCSKDGKTIWQKRYAWEISALTIDGNGILVGTGAGEVEWLNWQGKTQWHYHTGWWITWVGLLKNNTVLVADNSASCYLLDSSGKLKKKTPLSGWIVSSAESQEKVYMGATTGDLYVVDKKDVSITKKTPVKGTVLSIAVHGDKVAVAGNRGVFLYGTDLDTPLWQKQIYINEPNTLKITSNGDLVFAGLDRKNPVDHPQLCAYRRVTRAVFCLDADGKERWRQSVGARVVSLLPVTVGGTEYVAVGAVDRTLYLIKAGELFGYQVLDGWPKLIRYSDNSFVVGTCGNGKSLWRFPVDGFNPGLSPSFFTKVFIQVTNRSSEDIVVHLLANCSGGRYFSAGFLTTEKLLTARRGKAGGAFRKIKWHESDFIKKGAKSGWIDISQMLDSSGRNNNFTVTAFDIKGKSVPVDIRIGISPDASGKNIKREFPLVEGEKTPPIFLMSRNLHDIKTAREELDMYASFVKEALKHKKEKGQLENISVIVGGLGRKISEENIAFRKEIYALYKALGANSISGIGRDKKLISLAAQYNLCPGGYWQVSQAETCRALFSKPMEKGLVVNKLFDEPSWRYTRLKLEDFFAYFKKKGIKPGDLGVADFSEIKEIPKPDAARTNPRLWGHFFKAHLEMGLAKFAAKYRQRRDALDKGGCQKVGITVTTLGTALFAGSKAFGIDWWESVGGFFDVPAPDLYPSYYSPLYAPSAFSYLNEALVSSVRDKGGKYMAYPAGNYFTTPDDFRWTFYQCIAHGAKGVFPYVLYPQFLGNEASWMDQEDMIVEFAKLMSETKDVEQVVSQGKRRPASIALIYPETTELYHLQDNLFNLDSYGLYTALVHNGYNVDILSEKQAEKNLDNYRAILFSGDHLPAKLALKLKHWIGNGGLFISSGGGLKDEFSRDQPWFGVKLKRDGIIGGIPAMMVTHEWGLPKWHMWENIELVHAYASDKVKLGSATFPVVAWKQELEDDMKGGRKDSFTAGGTAVASWKLGKGNIVLFNFLPGLSYLKSAKKEDYSFPYWIGKDVGDLAQAGTPWCEYFKPTYRLTGYDRNIRDYLSSLLDGKAKPVCDIKSSSPIEVLQHDSGKEEVIFLINHLKDKGNAELVLDKPPAQVTPGGGVKISSRQGKKLKVTVDRAGYLKIGF